MNKHGFTLVGIMVYMVIVSLITGLAITAYVQFTRIAQHQERNLQEITDMVRFGERLRKNIRAAVKVRASRAGDTLTLAEADGSVQVYFRRNGVLQCLAVGKTQPQAIVDNVASMKVRILSPPQGEVVEVTCILELPVPVKHDRRPIFVFAERLGTGGAYARE